MKIILIDSYFYCYENQGNGEEEAYNQSLRISNIRINTIISAHVLEYKMSSNGSPNSPDVDDICCLIDEGERCQNPAASVQWTKKFAKAVGQKRLHISADTNVCRWH